MPTKTRLFVYFPIAIGIVVGLSFVIPFPWRIATIVLSLVAIWMWIYDILFLYRPPQWVRIYKALDHAAYEIAEGLESGEIPAGEGLKELLATVYPRSSVDGIYAEMLEQWERTHRFTDWFYELLSVFVTDRAGFRRYLDAEANARRGRGMTPLDVATFAIRRECSVVDLKRFCFMVWERDMGRPL